jgi:hypothetical protein
MLNSIANFYFHAHRSKVFTVLSALILVACVALLAAARPKSQEDISVYELNDNTSLSASIDRYFNVRGQLQPAARYQSEARSGSFRFSASTYVPIQLDSRSEPIFVLDQDIPAPKTDGSVTFVGRLSASNDPVVNYFLEVNSPTNVPLINRLASIGMGVAVLMLLGLLMGALVSRSDYAISTNASALVANASNSSLWWFGNLGARHQNALARQAPVQLDSAAHDLTLNSLGKEPWAIVIKRVTQTQRTHIATSFGALPALRLRFEDERGLMRRGVLVMSDDQARQNILERLTQ